MFLKGYRQRLAGDLKALTFLLKKCHHRRACGEQLTERECLSGCSGSLPSKRSWMQRRPGPAPALRDTPEPHLGPFQILVTLYCQEEFRKEGQGLGTLASGPISVCLGWGWVNKKGILPSSQGGRFLTWRTETCVGPTEMAYRKSGKSIKLYVKCYWYEKCTLPQEGGHRFHQILKRNCEPQEVSCFPVLLLSWDLKSDRPGWNPGLALTGCTTTGTFSVLCEPQGQKNWKRDPNTTTSRNSFGVEQRIARETISQVPGTQRSSVKMRVWRW